VPDAAAAAHAAAASAAIAALEGTEAALVVATGAAARACTLRALLRAGDHLLASDWLDAQARDFLAHELPAMGVAVTFVDPREARAWRRALTPTTRVVYAESPVRADGHPVDLRACRTLAQELGLAFVIDATAAPAPLARATALGADVVLHDARLLLLDDEACDAGLVCSTEAVVDEVAATAARWGAHATPTTVGAVTRSLGSFDARLSRRVANAARAATWLAAHAEATGAVRDIRHALDDLEVHAVAGHTIVTFALVDAARRDDVLVAAAETRATGGSRLSALDTEGRVRLDAGVEEAATLERWLSRSVA